MPAMSSIQVSNRKLPLNIQAAAAADVGALLAYLMAQIKPNYVPLSQWRNEVLVAYEKHHGNTRIKMRSTLREVIALTSGEDATTESLTPALVDRFATRAGRASSTNGMLASLRCALKIATKRGYVRHDLVAASRFRVRDRDVRMRKHHPRATIGKVLEHLKVNAIDWRQKRLHVFASILAYCGLRAGEAKRVKVEDLDLERGFLWVRPNGKGLKTAGSEAPVPIPEALAVILRDWLPLVKSEWLIPTTSRRAPWAGGSNGNRAGDQLRDEAASIGVEGFTPLSLRHSLATHLTGSWGLTRSQVKLVLRHTNEATQDYYVHPDLVTLRELVRDVAYTKDS